jgi:hypothetical protein
MISIAQSLVLRIPKRLAIFGQIHRRMSPHRRKAEGTNATKTLGSRGLPAVHRALNLTSVTIMGAVPPLAQ